MTRQKPLNIVFIYSGSFPEGGAYANRMLGFAKGLQELGNTVSFFVIYPGYNNLNNELSAISDGIKYEYTCGTIWLKEMNRLAKLKIAIFGIKNALKKIKRIQKLKGIDCIVFGTNNLVQTFPFYIYCKKKHFKMIREYNEYPPPELGFKRKIPFYTELLYRLEFNIFDGMILISRALDDFFKRRLSSKKRKILVPIIVDPARFTNTPQKYSKKKNIVFVGDVLGEKDGVQLLIDSFVKIHKMIPDQKLILIGDISDKKGLVSLKKKIEKKEIKDKIVFTGYIEREQVIQYLDMAKLVVLARPANKQAEAGFPTKLGEYLASGNPVICTKVGDIPLYLKDGENAFICEPGDTVAFSQKILEIFRNQNKAKQVGKNGRKLVFKEFNYKFQSKRVEDFIRNFNK